MALLVLNTAQAFNLSPSEAWAEIYERNPAGWVQELLSIEHFRTTWAAMRRETAQANNEQWLPPGVEELRDRVLDAEATIAQLAARQREGA